MPTDWGRRIDRANEEAIARLLRVKPTWIGVVAAREIAHDMGPRDIFHAGPPVTWDRMSGAQRGAVTCAVLFEGWAASALEATALCARGEIRFGPNHEHGGVGPMAGVVSPSMPVFVVEDQTSKKRVYAALEEPRMNFGAFDADAVALRRYWRDKLSVALDRGAKHVGGIELLPIMQRALHRGDELHNRPAAATSSWLVETVRAMLLAGVPQADVIETLEFVHADELFFLSLAMGASKLMADAMHGVEDATVVTALARNGTDFGMRVSGLGDRWFTAPSPVAQGLYLPGFSERDAGRDMGDSAITETVGLGGMVLVGAPAIFEMVGGTTERAFGFFDEMRAITVARHPSLTVPTAGFAGAPVGIDMRKVVETQWSPVIDTAIAHREPGFPIIGAGLTRPPIACFEDALRAFAAERGVS